MYKAFENMRNLVRTETNSRIFLEDPKLRNGEFTTYLNYISYGTMEVITQPQKLSRWEEHGPLYMLPWYIENMQGEGNSDLGVVKVSGRPDLMSTGIVRQNVQGQAFPATLEASVFQVIEIPGYGKLHHKSQVAISAVVDGLPPWNALCRCLSALLFNEANETVGVIAGRALTIMAP